MAVDSSKWGTREEMLHPRGKDGRFRSKWKMATGVVDALMKIIGSLNPRTFPSDAAASQYLSNKAKPGRFGGGSDYGRLASDYHDTNMALRAGQMDASTKKFVSMMDNSSIEAPDDMILHRRIGPEGLGLTPESMSLEDGGVEDFTGRLVADRGYTSTGIGMPRGDAPIQMSIAVPKGTKVIIPARNSGDPQVYLDRDQEIRVTKVDPDGRGGFYVYAVATPRTKGDTPEPIGTTPRADELAPPADREARATNKPLSPSERRTVGQDKAEADRLAEVQRRQQAGELPPQPAPQPAAGQAPGPGEPPPRTEPVVTEAMGTGAPQASPSATTPQSAPGATPEQPVREQDFRTAVREAGLPSPSRGKRRAEWNNAYLNIASGKKDPGDLLRELDSDIAFNKETLAEQQAGRAAPDPTLEADIKVQEQLADLISQHFNIPRREGEKAERPAPAPAKQGGLEVGVKATAPKAAAKKAPAKAPAKKAAAPKAAPKPAPPPKKAAAPVAKPVPKPAPPPKKAAPTGSRTPDQLHGERVQAEAADIERQVQAGEQDRDLAIRLARSSAANQRENARESREAGNGNLAARYDREAAAQEQLAERLEKAAPVAPASPEADIDKMTKAELARLAESEGIPLSPKLTRIQQISTIRDMRFRQTNPSAKIFAPKKAPAKAVDVIAQRETPAGPAATPGPSKAPAPDRMKEAGLGVTVPELNKIADREGVPKRGRPRTKAALQEAILERRKGEANRPNVVANPVAQQPVQAPDRRSDFETAWDGAGLSTPDSAAGRSIAEVRDDIAAGRLTPEEGIRRLETDIALNKEDLIEMDAERRGLTDKAALKENGDRRAKLAKDVKEQEKASTFLRRHFEKAPPVTPDEVLGNPEVQRTFGEMLKGTSPEEMAKTAKIARTQGLDIKDPKGDTAEEMFDDMVRQVIEGELKKRAAKKAGKSAPAKKVAPPKAPDKPKPNLPESKHQRLDADALAEGLDLTVPEDRKQLNDVQDMLDGKSERLGKNPTPAQVGRDLDQWLDGPASPVAQAVTQRAIGDRRHVDETDEQFQGRLAALDADVVQARERAGQWRKLAERLKNTRRQPKRDATPDVKPKVTSEEKADLGKVAEITGIPELELEKAALTKKKAEAPAPDWARSVVDTLKTVPSREEARDILQGRTKAELLEIAKEAKVPPRRGTASTKAQLVDDLVEGTAGNRISMKALGDLVNEGDLMKTGSREQPKSGVRVMRERALADLREQGFDNPRSEMVEEQMRTLKDQDERDLTRSRSGGASATAQPQAAPGTAAGKLTVVRVAPGTRLLVDKDQNGNWKPASRKTGATTITVTETGRTQGGSTSGGTRAQTSRVAITGTDEDGNTIKLPNSAPSQTFILAGDPPAKKAAPVKAAAAPSLEDMSLAEIKELEDELGIKRGSVDREDRIKVIRERQAQQDDARFKRELAESDDTEVDDAVTDDHEEGEGSALSRAQARQEEFDRLRPTWETLSEVMELTHNGASREALLHRLRSREKATPLKDKGDILTLIDKLEGDATPAEMMAAVQRIAGFHGLKRVGEQGEGYDPKIHAAVGGGIEPGAKVEVIRPGFRYRNSSDEDDTVVQKADVLPLGKGTARPSWDAEPPGRVASRTTDLSASKIHGRDLEDLIDGAGLRGRSAEQLKRIADEENVDLPSNVKTVAARQRVMIEDLMDHEKRAGHDPDRGVRRLRQTADRLFPPQVGPVKKVAPRKATTAPATSGDKSIPSVMDQLNSQVNPLTRQVAHALLQGMSKEDLLAIARGLSVPGASNKTMAELRREIVEATAGRFVRRGG